MLPFPLSNPNKVFWPDEGYTKGDLARFYQSVFPSLRPFLRDRILALERCPDGMRRKCFFQKEMPPGMPPRTPTARIASSSRGKSVNYVVGGSLATQLSLVNLGCVAVHVMGTRSKSLRKPDWICFDLDPQSGRFGDAARAAFHVKEALDSLKLASFAKTSGGRGLHIFAPIRVGPDTDEVLEFAKSVVARVAAAHPNELTVEHSVAARGRRVYLDAFRNAFGQTVVAPYSVRLRPKAPVSTPLDWSEVKPDINPAEFNLGNIDARLKKPGPWRDFFKRRESFESSRRLLNKL